MPTPETLRLRLRLISKFDQLAARLEAGDETAVEAAHDHICGLVVCDDASTLALVMKALAGVLSDFQDEIDENGYRYPRSCD